MKTYEKGYIKEDGTLVPSDGNELIELVEEVTGLDALELRDLSLDALGAEYLNVSTIYITNAIDMTGVDYKCLIINAELLTPSHSRSIPVKFVANYN